MAQDSDVARMAAALRTPSLRYRSFGNEAVRNAPAESRPEELDSFPLLGDALAAIESLPPDVMLPPDPEPTATPVGPDLPVMMAPITEPVPVPPAPVVPIPAPPVVATRPAPAPAPPPVVPASQSYVPSPRPAPPPPAPITIAPLPVPPRTPPKAASSPGLTLLQTLLAEAPARPAPADNAPIVVGRHPPQAVAPSSRVPDQAPPEPILPTASPIITRRGLVPPLPPIPTASDRGAGGTPRNAGPGTGSSLLDMLVGRGDASQSATQYPLLDAVTTAMRSDLGGASSRVWPAARVEMALPELLRRVAAGVRTGRGLN